MSTTKRSMQEATRLIGGQMLLDGFEVSEVVDALKVVPSTVSGGINASECLYWLNEIHRYCHRKVMIVWDGLPAHHAAASIMEEEHPHWFEFFFFPPYSPERNPVKPCWHHAKNVEMANDTAKDKEELSRKIFQAADNSNHNKQLLHSFFKYARLKL